MLCSHKIICLQKQDLLFFSSVDISRAHFRTWEFQCCMRNQVKTSALEFSRSENGSVYLFLGVLAEQKVFAVLGYYENVLIQRQIPALHGKCYKSITGERNK